MSLVLASAWQPRGELARFERLLPQLSQLYRSIVISTPPTIDQAFLQTLNTLPNVRAVPTNEWVQGRHVALAEALKAQPNYIHAIDFDRALRWIETRPNELTSIAQRSQTHCLIIGRTWQAYATHARALIETERTSNTMASFFLGTPMDFSAGARGFTPVAAHFILANSPPIDALGTDAEWPILLHRGGFKLNYCEVDGLDWEIPDQFQAQAADVEAQQSQAATYDRNVEHWRYRVEVAQRIVQAGIAAARRPLQFLS
ncbi:hypothetical protein [Herpetosiphon geysericola]|uniref:Glycosyltransferase n=1 Tax=Herpetosiphon geysericola TaxID=70996 RepID=A0A0P6YGB3_9CHLR|nr:hypothetical protein [Herpetosiphon geysericola]KPL81283.1 hypothetical protein SE18_21655 [Herpetosiphon geysericola]